MKGIKHNFKRSWFMHKLTSFFKPLFFLKQFSSPSWMYSLIHLLMVPVHFFLPKIVLSTSIWDFLSLRTIFTALIFSSLVKFRYSLAIYIPPYINFNIQKIYTLFISCRFSSNHFSNTFFIKIINTYN